MSALLAIDTAAPRPAACRRRDDGSVDTLIEDMATGQPSGCFRLWRNARRCRMTYADIAGSR